MKKVNLILAAIVFLFCVVSATAQDTLVVKTMLGTYRIFDRKGNQLKLGYVLKSAKEIPEARKYFRRARWYQAGTYIVGMPAAFLFGYEGAYYLTGGKWHDKKLFQYSLIGLGVNHVFAIMRNSAVRKGARAYNNYQSDQKLIYDLPTTP